MGRVVIGSIIGLIAGGLFISLVQMVSHSIYGSVDFSGVTTREDLRLVLEEQPKDALIWVAISHYIGTFFGGMIAYLISGRKLMAMWVPIGLLFVATLVLNLAMPHPTWFIIVDLMASLLGGLICFLIGRKWAVKE